MGAVPVLGLTLAKSSAVREKLRSSSSSSATLCRIERATSRGQGVEFEWRHKDTKLERSVDIGKEYLFILKIVQRP